MNSFFINDALTKAIDDYQKSYTNQQGVLYNSFLVVVVRMLINIYSELDIVNPLSISNEELFKNNLTKYGYTKNRVNLFLENLRNYYRIEEYNAHNTTKFRNDYFIIVQKDLIDMFIAKKNNYQVTEEETKYFYELLYTPSSPNPLRVSFNFLMTDNALEVDNYFKTQLANSGKKLIPEEKHYLNIKAYELLNYSMDDIRGMDSKGVDRVNTQVYDYFKIRENAINKDYLLDRAIEALERENNKVTSGNGFVDILLVLSIIATAGMLASILAFIVF